MSKKYKLNNIVLSEVSLVDTPANQESHVVLTKRKGEPMATKLSAGLAALFAPIVKTLDKDVKEEFDKGLGEFEKTLTAIDDTAETGENGGEEIKKDDKNSKEEVVKGGDSVNVEKAIADAVATEVAKAVAVVTEENAALKKSLEDMQEADELNGVIATLQKSGVANAKGLAADLMKVSDIEVRKNLIDMQVSSAVALQKSGLMQEVGDSGEDVEVSAYDAIMKIAKDRVEKSGGETSIQKAFSDVYNQRGDLRTAYKAERKSAH